MTVKEILSKYGLSLTKSSRYYGDLMKEITWTYIYIYIYIYIYRRICTDVHNFTEEA